LNSNLTWHQALIGKADRARQKRQRPCVIWFTGLSGAGKSTLANALEHALFERGHHSYLLDGDNVRHGLNRDLGFSDADREENIRRIAEVAKLFVDAGLIVMTAFISPFRADRQLARQLLGADEFVEVHVATPLAVCEERDPKGLYRKARAGQIPNFTGIDSAYEPPLEPEVVVDTAGHDLDACVGEMLVHLERLKII
jgi:adenylyl-sulfate kinase